MEPTAHKPQDIVDTTDSLEAVGACRSMKNFLFWIIFIGLLLPQIVFWLDRLGLVDRTACAACKPACVQCDGCSKKTCDSKKACEKTPPKPSAESSEATSDVLPPLAATVETPTETASAEVDADILLEETTKDMPAEMPLETAADTVDTETIPAQPREPFRLPSRFIRVLIVICNFLTLMAAMLYCLSLLMCLKISLTGRLGGVNHMTRSFFVSLLLVMILIPWQKIIPGVLIGTIWMPGELLCGRWAKADSSTFWKTLFYLRFAGLWLIAMWLLFWAQIRSAKWAQATLRRLGIVR